MECGACGHCELKAVLHTLQVCSMAYEVFSILCIRYHVDAATEFAQLICVGELFSFVHVALALSTCTVLISSVSVLVALPGAVCSKSFILPAVGVEMLRCGSA
jgi:hypothetical protein